MDNCKLINTLFKCGLGGNLRRGTMVTDDQQDDFLKDERGRGWWRFVFVVWVIDFDLGDRC